MVDFNDVRQESEPTYFFFARALRKLFEHALEECHITGWKIITKREALQYLPEDFVMPEVRISPWAPRIEKDPMVFVSHYNTDDMARKLFRISNDPDIIAWSLRIAGELAEAYERGEIY